MAGRPVSSFRKGLENQQSLFSRKTNRRTDMDGVPRRVEEYVPTIYEAGTVPTPIPPSYAYVVEGYVLQGYVENTI